MADIEKHLERAEKYLAKGKYEAAIEEYKAALQQSPNNLELLRTVADLCVRAGNSGEATRYYGDLFDKLAERNDATKAVLLFRKSLQPTPQPPERHARLGALLQRQGKSSEASEAYRAALELFRQAGNAAGIYDCLDRLAALEPDTPETQVELGEQAQRMGKSDAAAKAFLRAGQLLRAGGLPRALDLLMRAHEIQPDRTSALALAQARLDNNQGSDAAELLMPYYADPAGAGQDGALLDTLGSALLAAGRLPEAAEVLEAFYQIKPDTFEKLFDLAGRLCQAGQAEMAVKVLQRIKQQLFAAKRQNDFVERLDVVFKANETVAPLAEFAAATYNELNKESKYFRVLTSLFRIYFGSGDFKRAADTLERLIDIDPYDFHNQEYLGQLRGKIEEARFRAVASRISSAATVSGQAAVFSPTEEKIDQSVIAADPVRRRALLEDMMVQVELFLQYSLTGKAIEKLQKVWELFPGEESGNQRLYDLYARAQYFPPGFGAPPSAAAAAAAPVVAMPAAPLAPVAAPVETSNDLAKIAEITHSLFRQTTPKTVLNTAVSELGKYLRASRCLGVLGRPDGKPTTAVEWCAPGVPQSPGPAVLKLLGILNQANLDAESGAVLTTQLSPEISQVGAQSVLAMPLIDKEKQEQLGLVVVAQADQSRNWKANEVYLVRAVATQVESAVTHIQLRSLMKKYAVGDEGGLLGRGSYLDTLVSEAKRSRTVGTPMVLVLFELDKGNHIARQVGEGAMRQFMERAGEIILGAVRQSDIAFRYTTTSLAVLLGDTTAQKAKPVVEKLRKQLAALDLPGGKDSVSFCAGMSEAAIRPDYDPLDIVTDVINRAEFSLEAAREQGNTVVVQ